MNDTGFVESLLILIAEHNIGVTKPTRIACFEIFGLHYLDGECIFTRLFGAFFGTIDGLK